MIRRYAPALLLLAGCATEPAQDVVLAPDARYPEWYHEVVLCSGHTGRYSEIRWFVLDDDSPNAGETWNGHDVYIKLRYATSSYVVKHEMLHTLIDDGDHTSPAWRACGLAVMQNTDY